jgi:hypothetical protein
MVPQVSCFHFRSKHKTRNKCVQHFKLQVLRLQCLSKMDKHQQVTVTPTRIKTAKPLSFLTAPPPLGRSSKAAASSSLKTRTTSSCCSAGAAHETQIWFLVRGLMPLQGPSLPLHWRGRQGQKPLEKSVELRPGQPSGIQAVEDGEDDGCAEAGARSHHGH